MNVEARNLRTPAEQAIVDRFDELRDRLPGNGWVRDMRLAAMSSFAETGLPHRRIEEWKYTDLRAAVKELYPAADGARADLPADRLAAAGYPTVTIVNGEIAGDLPAIEGVSIRPISEALEEGGETVHRLLEMMPARGTNPVFDINTATMRRGLMIQIAPGTKMEKPLHVRSFVGQDRPVLATTRHAVAVGAGAEATIIESFEGGEAPLQRNAAIQIDVGDRASLSHLRIEEENAEAVHLSNIVVEIGAEARYRKFGLAIGAALMRDDLSIRFNGEHSEAVVDSVFLKTGSQHHDTTMYVDHAVPNCRSRELFKSVLGGRARGVFQGKIMVRPHAQKTDGKMSANAILLTGTAEMDAKPELEIYADDVVCGHGATAGQLDENLLFFLRARGIPERDAKALLILAFIGEALEDVDNEFVHDHLMDLTGEWIANAEI